MYEICIYLIDGHDLVIRDSNGTSDPFVKFKYNQKTIHKSKTVFKNLNPVWNEQFTFVVKDLSIPVKIEVKDYDRFASDEFMGSAELYLNTLEHSKTSPIKLMLENNPPSGYMGYINLGVSIQNVQNSPEREKSLSQGTLLFRKTLSFDRSSKKQSSISSNKTLSAIVNVVIVKARHLLYNDGPSDSRHSLPSPLVQVKIGQHAQSTKAAEKTLRPHWYEKMTFLIYDSSLKSEIAEFTVIDKRKSVQIGKCTVELGNLAPEISHKMWLELGDASGSLFCLITISIPATFDTISDIFSYDEDLRPISADKLNVHNYSLFSCFNRSKEVGLLTVKVYKAQGLASADIDGKSDPYCVVELVNSRLQTEPVYGTLNPQWNKMFSFHVRDIHSIIEITVLDQDSNGESDFLGKLAIPLLTVKSNEKKWYALKDQKLSKRVKGQIMLEFEFKYNVLKAAYNSYQPREQKISRTEPKLKRRIFSRNLARLKAFNPNINIFGFLGFCLSWESIPLSASAFFFSLLFVYYFELYMIPLMLVTYLVIRYAQILVVHKFKPSDINEYAESDKDEEEESKDDKSENISFKERWNEIQDQLLMMQELTGFAASCLERIKNCFNFTQPFLSWMLLIVLLVVTVILYFVPLRWIIMIFIFKKFTKKLRNPHSVPHSEIVDFLSRVPNDEEMKIYSEFRPKSVVSK